MFFLFSLKRFILVEERTVIFYFSFYTNEKRQFCISFSTVLLKQYKISQGGYWSICKSLGLFWGADCQPLKLRELRKMERIQFFQLNKDKYKGLFKVIQFYSLRSTQYMIYDKMHLSEFLRTLRSWVLEVFKHFLLIEPRDRSKIGSDQDRIKFDISISISSFVNSHFKAPNDCIVFCR